MFVSPLFVTYLLRSMMLFMLLLAGKTPASPLTELVVSSQSSCVATPETLVYLTNRLEL